MPTFPSRKVNRRQFVKSAALVAGFPALSFPQSTIRFEGDPFSLGVASGYPEPDGVVLWTRLAPEPRLGGGMPLEPVNVTWEVATDERLQNVVQEGQFRAVPEYAHAVHVEVFGLSPDRGYFYRFRTAGAESVIGRTRTAPEPAAGVDRLRFAFASCQHYEQGYFCAFRDIASADLDLVLHLGDYIYESSWGVDHVRKHEAPEPVTLEDYRARYALYRLDPDLQAAHAACPWLVTWDDHEVDNDYADDRSEDLHPTEWFLRRRAAAYRAYYEHMPLRRRAHPLGPRMRLYGRSRFGALADFFMLDDRQYRDYQACSPPGEGGSSIVSDCWERLRPEHSLLGEVQERWLSRELGRSTARWNVLGQQTLMAQLDRTPGPERSFSTDGWDGYPAARSRLLRVLEEEQVHNPIVVGGDVHSFWAADLKRDFDDPQGTTVATEFVCSGVTSQTSRRQEEALVALEENRHIRFVDVRPRGYSRVELTPTEASIEFRTVRDVRIRESPLDTLATFRVEEGRAGVERV